MPGFKPVIRTVVLLAVLLTALAVGKYWKDSTTQDTQRPKAYVYADRYAACVNCPTSTPGAPDVGCPTAGTGRYAQFQAAGGSLPWACCPVGYTSEPKDFGQKDPRGKMVVEIICVPVPAK
jgi:hypothetical protein